MKRVLLLLLINCQFSIFNYTLAQNLVPNWSFEDTIKCPNSYDRFVGYVADWGGGGEIGMAYLNSSCNPSGSEVGVPLNWIGYQYPLSGNAYVEIATLLGWGPDSNLRNYLQATLTTPLVAGVTYYAAFYVSLADSCQYACSNMGIYFSDSALYYPTTTFVKSYLTPQIQNDTTNNPLTNRLGWTKISGSYKAVGGEKYMVIGNFLPNYKCDSVYYPPDSGSSVIEPAAFYYIDDVILSPDSNYADSLMGVAQLKMDNGQLKIYPNPNNGVFTLSLSHSVPIAIGIVSESHPIVQVYNMLGQKVYMSSLGGGVRRTEEEIDLSTQPSGIYLYRVTTQTGKLINAGKLMIVH